MNMAEMCRLCLRQKSDTILVAMEDDELRQKIDRIFYFQVIRNQDVPSLVCDACKHTVIGFYEYAEQVLKNQQFLRATLVPSTSATSLGAISSQETLGLDPSVADSSIKLEYAVKKEPDETEWVAVDTYCETTIGAMQSNHGELNTVADLDDVDIDFKEDHDWKLNDSAEEEEDEESEDSLSDGDEDWNDDEESMEDTKPKRKYTPRKHKKSNAVKPEKKECKPRQRQEGPTIDELVLEHYKLSCDLCAEPLEDFTDLRKHYKYVHDQPGYLKCCNKKIFKKCWMVEHIQLHLNPDAFHCDICNKSYSSSKVLKEHTKEVHSPNENRPFKCETCLKPFVSHAHLNAHVMVAHGSVPCPQCPKVLASQGSLKKHLVAMHGDGEQYVCDVCARVFRSKQCFDTHVKGHLGTRLENKVQCSVCSVWLTDKYCLTKHVRRMHVAPDLPLSCELCGKQVRNQDALNCHMRRTHTESRFECDICHKKFKRPHHMREHVAIHHTGEDLYGCNHCPERFNTKNKQYMHRKTVHPVEWEEEMRKRIMKVA
ncbi:transcription factor grauzone-like [Topomyia yanbarensis]|uniref:transcription factor grauzone-like n=1 Tax=Topomyia yanbarensis TaxID=2498891 RepID=UPI00273C9C2B|nr:transcription factor grauzone-like [Topomyia yanbarensis]